ncbi:DUF6368 family protein [Maricaulis sp.]|uniref:DUF6368 family protein n=1 Tax=Maricaulis sp. TaxID=1486257 RepID=UPI001B0DAA66|nr:DUF6368 family protein [Maricaulis sp.]MBO6797459.1 hypothetical protein [Maricaulis sp.]
MGPVASALIRQALSREQKARLVALLKSRASHWREDDFWFCPSSKKAEQADSLTAGFFLETESFYYPADELDQIERVIGFRPRAIVSLSALSNQPADHHILAELIAWIAQEFDRWIDFGGSILPVSIEPLGPGGEIATDAANAYLDKIGGRVFSLPYLTASGEHWVSHVCDPEFARNWMEHDDFHMVK